MPRDNVERAEEAGDVHLQEAGAGGQALHQPDRGEEGTPGTPSRQKGMPPLKEVCMSCAVV